MKKLIVLPFSECQLTPKQRAQNAELLKKEEETPMQLTPGEKFWGFRSKGTADSYWVCTYDTTRTYYFRFKGGTGDPIVVIHLKKGELFWDFQSKAEADELLVCIKDSTGGMHISFH